MLVLTRKLMEKLFIGDDICVTVVRLEGGQVRLGIDAPREIAVVRAELVPERLAAAGKAIIVISSELPEILRLSHRIAVMCEGRLTGILPGGASQERIMALATQREGMVVE